jgi:arylformamidase
MGTSGRTASAGAGDEHRVCFDFEVEFSNGGGLQGQDFRLDIPGEDIEDEQLVAQLVRELRLLMVGRVRILNKRIIRERHKGAAPTSDPLAPEERIRVDLSHTVRHGMTTYPGLPAPVLSDVLTREDSRSHYAEGTEFHIGQITLCANTGTYVDSPFHRYAGGTDLAGLSLDRLADVEGVLVDVTGTRQRAVGATELLPYDVRGRAVLVRTGWDRHWGTDAYFDGHPHLTEDAARHLVEQEAALVGIDSLNIDATDGRTRPVHSLHRHGAADDRLPLQRRAGEGRRHGHLPRPRLRHLRPPATAERCVSATRAYHPPREASGFLVGPTVFNTDEAASGRLAGSIPVRLRSRALASAAIFVRCARLVLLVGAALRVGQEAVTAVGGQRVVPLRPLRHLRHRRRLAARLAALDHHVADPEGEDDEQRHRHHGGCSWVRHGGLPCVEVAAQTTYPGRPAATPAVRVRRGGGPPLRPARAGRSGGGSARRRPAPRTPSRATGPRRPPVTRRLPG